MIHFVYLEVNIHKYISCHAITKLIGKINKSFSTQKFDVI